MEARRSLREFHRLLKLIFIAGLALSTLLLTSNRAYAGEPPVAAYSFDAGEGEVAEDAAGEHDGTIEGAAWTKGRFGGALEFDGEAGDLVTIPGTEDLQLEEFTVEAWVRPAQSDLLAPVAAKLDDEEFGYALYAGGDNDAGYAEGYVLDGKSIDAHAVDDEALPEHAWSHIAVTVDGAHIRLYVNGELADTDSASDVEVGGEGPLTIGGNEAFEEGEYFSGKIDEVRVYDRALNAGEIGVDKGSGIASPASGPIAAYSFDAGEGEVAEDAAGGHDGTVEGPGWTKGKFGRALEFDGEAGDLVTIPGTEDLQLEEFTVEAWVRPAQSELLAPVVAKLDDEDFGYALYAGGDGAAGYPEGYVLDGKSIDAHAVDDEALTEHAWSHVAVTNDGAHIRLYVNGELVDTGSASDVKAGGGGPLTIGGNEAFEAGEYFSGKIDEVRVYSRALDAGEVAADKGAPIRTPPAAPVAAYSFDEGEGSTVEDAAGEHDGTIEGPGWTKGKFGGALEFDGEAGDLVTVPGTEDLQFEEFTVEAWVRPAQSDLLAPIVAKLDEEEFGYALYSGGDNAAGRPQGYLLEGKQISATAFDDEELAEHAWSHIAVTNDGAHIRLYVNGELEDTSPVDEDVKAGGEGPLTIGGNEAFEAGEYFSGKIDEVWVYDRALDADEIATDKNSGIDSPATAPVAAYSFDAGEGEVAEDVFGENDGAIEGAEWFEHGRFGSALYFDGSEGDLVTVPDSNDLDLTDEFTLEAWVRPDEANEWSAVITKEREGGLSYQMHAEGEGNAPVGYVQNSEGSFEVEAGDDPIPPHVWSHLAMTYDGQKLRYYVNGEFEGSDDSGDPGISENPLFIGGDNGGEEDAFKGLIDEVRIYSRVLYEDEVSTDLRAGIQSPSRAPVAAYSFDAGEGTTTEDLTGNEHNGVIKGASWFANGKYGKALSFDGEDDVVTVPDTADLRLEEFTLEAWVRPVNCGLLEPVVAKLHDEELGYALYAGGDSNAGRPEGYILDGKEIDSHAVDSNALPRHAWSHIAVTRDGAELRLYVDGELVDTGWASAVMAGGEGPMQIGGNESFVNPEYFEGLIDEVRIYNRALGEEELRQTMEAALSTATTEAATDLGANDAILNGTLKSNGPETEYYFEYGETPAYGSIVTGEELDREPDQLEINQAIINLSPETAYHYRLVADGLSGLSYGKDMLLMTGNRTMSEEEEKEIREAEKHSELTPKAAKAGPKSFYGMMWTGDLSRMLDSKTNAFQPTEESGAKWIKLPVGKGFPKEQTKEAFEEAKAHSLTILPGMGGGPIPKPETSLRSDWLTYAAETVKTYGPNSSYKIKTWEIWNEPNMPHPITFEQGENQEDKEAKEKFKAESIEKVNPKAFAKFFDEMATVMRAAAKEGENKEGIEILAPGLFGYRSPGCNHNHTECHQVPRQFLKVMNEELGGPTTNAYDAINIHPYVFRLGKAHKQHAPTKQEIVELVEAIHQSIVELHKVRTDLPIWVTELGFPVENLKNPKLFPNVTLPVQRLAVKASFAMMQSNRELLNIPHAFYYNLQDISVPGWDYHSGLLDFNGKKRPAWSAYKCRAEGNPC
jgi:hypothetical protein